MHASGSQRVSFLPQRENLPENKAIQRKAESRGRRDKDIELLVPAMTEDSDLWDSWIQGNQSQRQRISGPDCFRGSFLK